VVSKTITQNEANPIVVVIVGPFLGPGHVADLSLQLRDNIAGKNDKKRIENHLSDL